MSQTPKKSAYRVTNWKDYNQALGGDQEQIRIVSQFRTLMSHCPAYV